MGMLSGSASGSNLSGFPQAASGIAAANPQATPVGPGLGTINAMPAWQKGLMGAITGNSDYGTNAPFMHGVLQGGMQMMARGAQPGGGVAAMGANPMMALGMGPPPGPVQGAAQAFGNPGLRPMVPGAGSGMGAPGVGAMGALGMGGMPGAGTGMMLPPWMYMGAGRGLF